MRRWMWGLLVGASVWGMMLPSAFAAQSVVLKYRVVRETVPVKDLTEFSQTGQPSSGLRSLLGLARQNPQQMRQILTQEFEVNALFLDRVLNSALGEAALDQMSQVIRTPDNQANRQSLRAALMGSALPDGKVTLIEVLQNYPTPEVHLEGDRLVELSKQLRSFLNFPKIDLNRWRLPGS